MPTKIVIKKNTYFDSVSLMSVSTKANKLPGVEQAFVAMATEMNKGVLKNLGLLTPELAEAKNGDLMIVIKGDAANDETLAEIEALFTRKASRAAMKHATRRLPAPRPIARTATWRSFLSTAPLPLVKRVRRWKTILT